MKMEPIEQFARQKYLCQETFYRSSKSMKTAVWIVQESGIINVQTVANSGKVNGISNNPEDC